MFTQYASVADVKQAFKKLAFKLHPDRCGSHDAFIEMQAAYLAKLKSLNGQSSTGFDNKTHKYYYNESIEVEIIEKIDQLIKLKMTVVTIELVGTWIWLSGNTKQYKDKLKVLKLRWHGKRVKWYFHTKSYKRRMSKLSFDDIRLAYGSKTFENDKELTLTVGAS
tara:strand:+ start:366 stop:860 length:495 start_codon:yes stop_codon:yes gene_type:complete